MIRRKIVVQSQSGLEARTAAFFVQMANQFLSDIYVEKDTNIVNAKSIMGIMSLGIGKGETMILSIDGPDEEIAAEKLTQFIKDEKT